MSQRAFRQLVLDYAAVHRKAVQKNGVQWERGVNWVSYRAAFQQKARDLYLTLHAQGRTKAKAASRRVRKAADDGLFFDEASPEATSWAETRAATLVTSVDDSIKNAIRNYVSQAIQEGVPAKSLAKQLEGVVGLRPDQVDALEKIRVQLVAEGREQSEIDRLLNARGQRMLSQRATLIARTELTEAQNAGFRIEVAQQVAAGDLPETTAKEFMASPTSCKLCKSMNGQVRRLGADFFSDVTGQSYKGAAIHPACTCTESVVVLSPEEYARA